MMNKLLNILLALFLFVLPWQTRYIFAPAELNGLPWEYGSASLYATQVLLVVIVGLYVSALIYGRIPRLRWRMAMLSLWASGVVQGLLACWQFFVQHVSANKWLGMAAHWPGDLGTAVIENGGERWLRSYGSLGGPNPLGFYLAVILAVGVFLRLSASRREKWFLTSGQLLITAGLFFSFSRAAWLATVVGGILFIFLAPRKEMFSIGRQYGLYILLALSLAFAVLPLTTTRFDPSSRLESISLETRYAQYHEWGQVMKGHWLGGVGRGGYTWILYQYYPTRDVWAIQPVHNAPLAALAEVGLVAFAALIALVLWLIKLVFQRNRLFLPIWGVLLVAACFEHWPWTLWPGQIFALMIAFFGLVASSFSMCTNCGQNGDGLGLTVHYEESKINRREGKPENPGGRS